MDNKTSTRIITLKDLWDIFVHRLWIIALAALMAVIAVFAANKLTFEPRYASTATMYILRQSDQEISSSEASNDFSLALKVVNDCDYFLKSHTVLDAVSKELDLEIEYEDLYDSISTANPQDTRILEVTVEADSPKLAKKIVDSICMIGAESINNAMGYEQVNLYELGVLDDEPCNELSLLVYFIVGAVIAVLVYSIFFMKFLLDDTIKTDEDIDRYLGLSILGDIPDANASHKKGYGYRKGHKYGYGYRYGAEPSEIKIDSDDAKEVQ